MTIALKPRPVQRSSSISNVFILQPLWWARAWGHRLWWHTKAYTIILTIMVLALLSLIGLSLHHLLEVRQARLNSGDKGTKNNL